MSAPEAPLRVATIGAALSANKGAASMLLATLHGLPEVAGPCRFDVLTTYPDADRALLDPDDPATAATRIVSLRPAELVVPCWPLALLAGALRVLRLPWRWLLRPPALRALADADVVVDLAGISFVDGRPTPILGYNVAMTGLPLLLGRPTVKLAQATGPYRRRLNRLAARMVLPRLAGIVARGHATAAHLRDLGIEPVKAPDLAFALPVADADRRRAEEVLVHLGVGDGFVALAPSAVVQQSSSTDYAGAMAALADHVAAAGRDVVVFAHTARPGQPPSRMNDLPLVEEVVERATDRRVHLLDLDLSPAVLRALVERSAALVTSRFHAMVSAFATATPVLVVGWSHKYEEVLAAAGLEAWAVDHRHLDVDDLARRIDALLADGDKVSAAMAEALPELVDGARRNFELVAWVAGR